VSLIVKTPPVVEPVSLAEAKAHLRVDVADDDALIQDEIRGARMFLERRYDRALLTQTLVLGLDAFPAWWCRPPWMGWTAAAIELRPPVQSITSVTYLDTAGSSQTVSSADYLLDKDSEPGRLVPNLNKTWPATALLPGAVKIEFVAGVTIPELVAPDIRDALLKVVGAMYANREAVITGTVSKEIEVGLDDLMRSYRRDLVA
jgi:uncharacterized phiE125 gp8 family phage protein